MKTYLERTTAADTRAAAPAEPTELEGTYTVSETLLLEGDLFFARDSIVDSDTAGATVRMHQWVVHRDPRWYDDPLAFQPDRWSDDMEADLPKLAYFPFAAGPRRCIGDRFAMLEAQLLLATIYQQYHLELVPGVDLDLRATITARPKHEIPMTVRER